MVFPNPCHGPSQDAVFRQVYHSGSCRPYCHRLRVYHADKQFHSGRQHIRQRDNPGGFRPSGDSRAVMRGTDNSGAISFYLYGTPEGKMVLNGTGYTGRFVGISGCWITE